MSDRYVPQIGDRCKLESWGPNRWLDVTNVTRTWVIGDAENPKDGEVACPIEENWIKIVQVVVPPDQYGTCYANTIKWHPTLAKARLYAGTEDLVCIIHLSWDKDLGLPYIDIVEDEVEE
jgi:hypothetical protein